MLAVGPVVRFGVGLVVVLRAGDDDGNNGSSLAQSSSSTCHIVGTRSCLGSVVVFFIPRSYPFNTGFGMHSYLGDMSPVEFEEAVA